MCDPQVVPLVSGGRQKRVTDNNKLEYLSHLAQYHLVSRVADEVKHFLKGISRFHGTSVVPF